MNTPSQMRAHLLILHKMTKLCMFYILTMYLKFGFGRATDADIEIRRGAMTRTQGLNLVKMYDNFYPKDFINLYLDYYKISLKQFNFIIDKWANKKLFKKNKGIWKPKFSVK